MNAIHFVFSVALIMTNALLADSKRVSFEMGVCQSLEFDIAYRLDHEGKGVPSKWNDFVTVERMQSGMVEHQLGTAKAINSFALVPGAPVIGEGPGISPDYIGHRLFLISRAENFTKNSGSGRCAILIKPKDLDSKPSRTFSYFIPEEAAKAILRTIPSFDPEAQPLAFEDLTPFEEADRKFRQAVSGGGQGSIANNSRPRGNRQVSALINWINHSAGRQIGAALTVLCFVMLPVLGLLYWRGQLKKRRN
jgi:hypothetical protein